MRQRFQQLSRGAGVGKWLRLAKIASKPKRRHQILYREALRGPPLRFVQIGTNDGVEGDPLYSFIQRFGWTGVMVEPQPFVFSEKLEPLYRDSERVQLINAAVSTQSGTMPLYTLSFSDERWATGRASLDRSVLQKMVDSGKIGVLAAKHGVSPPDDPAEWIKTITVPAITVEELLATSSMTDFDLLHVDTEGADGMIVQQFDFSRFGTRIVQFEHRHLSAGDFSSTCRHLVSAGFELHYDSMDVLATRGLRIGRTVMKPLVAPWSRM